MPALLKFHGEHKDQSDKYEAICVHNKNPGATDFATLDKSIANKKSSIIGPDGKRISVPLLEAWGQPLPFTIMLDTEGTTAKAWGVTAYPTVCLVNPEGELVAVGEKAWEERLTAELAKLKAADKAGE